LCTENCVTIKINRRINLTAIKAVRACEKTLMALSWFIRLSRGQLMSYGVDILELFRQSAIYADRNLKGVNPADNCHPNLNS
jgi:hypothetical protein